MSKVWPWAGGIVVGLCIWACWCTGEPSAGLTGSREALLYIVPK